MLELYNNTNSVCAQKVRLALTEKGLQAREHMLELQDDQFDPAFREKLQHLPAHQNEYGFDPFGFHREDIRFAALIVRFFGSLFGAFQYSRWTRWAYRLTDWLVEPIAKVLPPYAGVDWSPLAAFIVLLILKAIL